MAEDRPRSARVERYVRLSGAGLLHPEDEYIVGLEFPLGESNRLCYLRAQLNETIHEAVGYAVSNVLESDQEFDALIAEGLHEAIDERWPGRAHFIEVQHDGPDGWVQVFQPYGLPQDAAG